MHAVDRDGPVPTLFAHSHNFPKKPDFAMIERAHKLLADAGYPMPGLPAITLLHNPSENHVKSATFVQTTLRENLNLKIDLKQEHKNLLARLHNHTKLLAMPAATPMTPTLPGNSVGELTQSLVQEQRFDQLLEQEVNQHVTCNECAFESGGEALQYDVPHTALHGSRSYLKVPVYAVGP